MGGPLLAIDGPLVAYRAFHSLPDSIRGADERPVNAVLGSVNAVLGMVEAVSPRVTVWCLGAETAPHRSTRVPVYHSRRPPMPQDLARQMALAAEVFGALGVLCLDAADPALLGDVLEADDLMASLAAAETAAGGATVLATADRDLLATVDDRVSMLLMRPRREAVLLDAGGVERETGVTPALLGDLKALAGDPSDDLPGAPGIGPKTAIELLRRHGDLEGVIAAARTAAAAQSMGPAKRASICDHADDLRAFRDAIALVVRPIGRPADRPIDRVAGAEAARRLGMGALARRLDGSASAASARRTAPRR